MKTPSDPNDPLLRSLAEEAADLPLKAALEARKTRALRMKQRRQVALTITVLFCGLCAWQLFPVSDTAPDSLAILLPADAPLQTAPLSLQPTNHVIVRTEKQASNRPLPLPELPDAPTQTAPFPFRRANHVIVRTEEQARNEPLPLPDGLTAEQTNVVKAARGLPLLLIHDSEGKVARIHVIER